MTAQAGNISMLSHSVRAESPAALLGIVPHLLGFVPESSLVIIGTDFPGGPVKITLRYDLPEPADDELAGEIAEHALAVLDTQWLTAAVAVGYGPQALVRPLAAAFRNAAGDGEVELAGFLRVEDGRYWSCSCTGQDCCPAEGTPFELGDQGVTAGVSGGSPVLANRDALAASIAPLDGAAAESMRQATRRAEQYAARTLARIRKAARLSAARHQIAVEGLAAVAEMIAIYRGGGRYRTDYQLAWLTVALKGMRVRDDAWARMDPGHCDAHRRMWTDVVRRAQPGYVAGPASLLAFVAWQAGNGALANVALDRALAENPEYSMATLLRQVISAGAPPSMARLPMTPQEIAAYYDQADQDSGALEDGGGDEQDIKPGGDEPG